jgi:hypothetical protein
VTHSQWRIAWAILSLPLVAAGLLIFGLLVVCDALFGRDENA